jgi:hypothetical protein
MSSATQGSGLDTLNAWVASVVANGGTVSAGRAVIVGTFIAAERASGAWDLTDDYWGLWAENLAQALTSLKQRRLAVATNSPTFTTDRGYAFNGTTQYIDTGFIPLTHAAVMTATSIHLEVYERAELSANTYAAGVINSLSRAITMRPRAAGNAFVQAGSAAATFTLPSASSLGLTQGGRNGAAVTDVYGSKNGVSMTRTVDPAAVGVSLPANSIFLGAYNNVGTAAGFRAASIGFSAVGAALSQAQRLARYNAVQAWATSVGANV